MFRFGAAPNLSLHWNILKVTALWNQTTGVVEDEACYVFEGP